MFRGGFVEDQLVEVELVDDGDEFIEIYGFLDVVGCVEVVVFDDVFFFM